jgi:acetyl-CoA carboxylase carboxyl transferase subunit alpha
VGEGGSGGALALAVADRIWMLENAVYSVISPESCANILWKEPSRAAEAAANLKLTSESILALGAADRIIPEKELGKDEFYLSLKNALESELAELMKIPAERLVESRFARFRKIGTEFLTEI